MKKLLFTHSRFNPSLLFQKIFIFFLPFQLGTYFFMPFSYINGLRVDYLALSFFISDVIFIFLFISNFDLIRNLLKIFFKNRYSLLYLAVLVVLIITNVVVAKSPEIAVFKWVKFAQMAVIFYIFKKTNISIKSFSKILLFSALVQVLVVVSQVVSGSTSGSVFYFLGERSFNLATPGIAKIALDGKEILRGYGTFPHPNSLSGFYLLIYVFFTFLPKRNGRNYFYENILLSVSIFLLFLSFSKFTFLVLLLVTLYKIFIIKDITCFICKISKIAIPGVLAVIIFSSLGDPDSLSKRFFLTKSAISVASENLLFGTGAGNYLYEQAKITHSYPYVFLQPVHNIFLLAVAELGVLIVVFIILFSILKLKKHIKIFLRNKLFVTLSLVIFLIGSFDHYLLTIQQNILLLSVILGMASSTIPRAKRHISAVVK